MVDPNPFQPPQNEANSQERREDPGPIRFAGGWYAVAGIGLLGGLLVACSFYVFTFGLGVSVNPMAMIVLTWGVASFVLVSIQKGIFRSLSRRLLVTMVAAPVGIGLFVFTCSAGSVAAGFGIYGDNISIPVVLSVICFVGVTLLIAGMLHKEAVSKQNKQRSRDRLIDDRHGASAYKDAINEDIKNESQQ